MRPHRYRPASLQLSSDFKACQWRAGTRFLIVFDVTKEKRPRREPGPSWMAGQRDEAKTAHRNVPRGRGRTVATDRACALLVDEVTSRRLTADRYCLHRLHRQQRQGSFTFYQSARTLPRFLGPSGASSYTVLTVLTVETVVLVSPLPTTRTPVWDAELILIVRAPPRPSRRKVISMPMVRRNVWARRSRPASARGLFGQAAPQGRARGDHRHRPGDHQLQ
jgi:hypothetical protein